MKDKNRSLTLDIMKTMLVLGMIAAHVFQLCHSGGNKLIGLFSLYINIITFSSFMFCFGCTSYIAYFANNSQKSKRHLLRNFFRLLICFYISGFAFMYLVSQNNNPIDYLKILILWRIPGYSEFLISFAILNIILLYFYKQISKLICRGKYALGGVIVVAILSTFIPYSMVKFPPIGIIIGTTRFSCFPVVQYLPFFLIGLYCQSRNVFYNKYLLFIAFLSTTFITSLFVKTHICPNRFPPSLEWILWAPAFTMGYYIISDKLAKTKMHILIRNVTLIYGRYTLDYLVISNVIIFAFRRYISNELSFFYCTVLIFAIYILCYLYGLIKCNKSKS